MVQYFTKDFFAELASRINADPEWAKKAGAVTTKLVLTCIDRNQSYLLDIQAGKVTSSDVPADTPADFKFEGAYDAWAILGRGEKDFQSLVISGKIKFRGSMPKMMAMMGQMNRLTLLAQQQPKEF